MYALMIVYRTGELCRLVCGEHEANRAATELNRRADVANAWVEVV